MFGDLLHLEHLDEDVGQGPPVRALDEDVEGGVAHVELCYAVGEGEVQDVVAFVPQSWIWNEIIGLVFGFTVSGVPQGHAMGAVRYTGPN